MQRGHLLGGVVLLGSAIVFEAGGPSAPDVMVLLSFCKYLGMEISSGCLFGVFWFSFGFVESDSEERLSEVSLSEM